MKKPARGVSAQKVDEFWAGLERSAASARKMPAWMKAGVFVNPEYYETTRPLASVRSLALSPSLASPPSLTTRRKPRAR